MGTGGSEQARGSQSGTRDRVAMNDEISLQRKIRTIYDGKTNTPTATSELAVAEIDVDLRNSYCYP